MKIGSEARIAVVEYAFIQYDIRFIIILIHKMREGYISFSCI